MTKRSVVHIEFPATSREETAKFYEALCGWESQHMTDPVPYTTFDGENIGGGFPDVGDPFPQPGQVVVYLSSDDIDADLQRVEELGGKTLMPKMAVGEMGWIGMFTDPTGNCLGFWTTNPDAVR
jgi:uncharacterized protein